MKKLIRIIVINLESIFSLWRMFSLILVFISINYITQNIYDITNFNDVIKFSFYGVNNLTDLPIELLKFSLCQMFLIYLTLNFLNGEINKRKILLLLRIGSNKLWINSLIISIFNLCIIYYAIGFGILSILNYKYLNFHINYMNLINTFILVILSGFAVCLISLLLIMFINNESIVFTIIMAFYYISIFLGNITSLDKYFIFNQGLLIKHYNNGFAFQWSYLYIILFSLIVYIIINKISLRVDV